MKIILTILLLINNSATAEIPKGFIEQVEKLIQKNSDKGMFVGLSVGIVSPENTHQLHFGYKDLEKKIISDKNTIYEIASISKTFTRLLFLNQNKISLSDSIDSYLPKGIRAPTPGGRSITFENLITHTGFLFSVPCAYRLGNNQSICFGFDMSSSNPYGNTSRESLYKFVNEYSYTVQEFPTIRPGLFSSYSNVGIGLVGEILAEKQKTTYEVLVKEQIFDVLGMNSTYISQKENCASLNNCPDVAKVYYKDNLADQWKSTNLWDFPGMAGAGGIRSNLNDMLIYLKANMGLTHGLIDKTLLKGQSYLKEVSYKVSSNICKKGQTPLEDLCNLNPSHFYAAWEGFKPGTILFHAGQTGGSQSMIVFSQDKSLGIILLSNSVVTKGKVGHYPNDLALCIFQMAGKPVSNLDSCKDLIE